MTLPASFPLSMSQIVAEVGLSLPQSITHPYIVALTQKYAPPVSFSELLGKTGRFDGSLPTHQVGSPFFYWYVDFGNAPFFGAILDQLQCYSNGTGPIALTIKSGSVWWDTAVLVKNNTTGVSQRLQYTIDSGEFYNSSVAANLIRLNQTDSFTILPSN